jgi:hypothetical protein
MHDLRHSGNTLAAEAGATPRELTKRMGDATTRAALIYLHSGDERDRHIADRLGGLGEQARQVYEQTRARTEHAPGPGAAKLTKKYLAWVWRAAPVRAVTMWPRLRRDLGSPAGTPGPALVAQGIEHRSPKAGVAGSNPAGGTTCDQHREAPDQALYGQGSSSFVRPCPAVSGRVRPSAANTRPSSWTANRAPLRLGPGPAVRARDEAPGHTAAGPRRTGMNGTETQCREVSALPGVSSSGMDVAPGRTAIDQDQAVGTRSYGGRVCHVPAVGGIRRGASGRVDVCGHARVGRWGAGGDTAGGGAGAQAARAGGRLFRVGDGAVPRGGLSGCVGECCTWPTAARMGWR